MGHSKKRKMQAEIINGVRYNIDLHARHRSSYINTWVNRGRWHRKYVLLALSVVFLLILGLGVLMYKNAFYGSVARPGGSVHQTIMAPHMEEALKEDLHQRIRKKVKRIKKTKGMNRQDSSKIK